MAIVIDADTHVVESEAMWEFFDEERRHLKPVLVGTPEPGTGRLRNRWVIGARLIPQPAGFGGHNAQAPPASPEDLANPFWGSKSLQDIPYRLNAADEMGVDVQVIYPTLFIVYLTGDPEIELGMCRAYNRFMADVWARSNGRMRWVVVPPLLSIDATIEELHYGVEHGAVGVMFRGMEGSRSISDPYFFPVYEEAARLNMPVCIHTGAGNPTVSQAFDTRVVQSFPQQRLLPLVGFHDLVLHRVPERFPDLRVGFIETSASWVPYLLHYLKHRVKDGSDRWDGGVLEEYRIFVACEADEDVSYLAECIPPNQIMIGSDYGHTDPSSNYSIVDELRSRETLDRGLVEKILTDNPARFYGI